MLVYKNIQKKAGHGAHKKERLTASYFDIITKAV